MTIKKTKRSAQFKFKVALEAAKGLKTRSQMASEFGVHPTQISQWKQALLKNGKGLFETRSKWGEKKKAAQEVALYEQIGRLKLVLSLPK